jgi:ribosome-binding ATPase YchF (GTP1/OBG family)
MKIDILGLPQAGQQELFAILSGASLDQIRQRLLEVQPGVCDVKDPRIKKLSEMYRPKKTVYARIEYSLLPDFTTQGPARTLILGELKNADVLCWVARAAAADKEVSDFFAELIINDLMLVEKRLENINRELKSKQSDERLKEKALLEACQQALNAEKPLSAFPFTEEQKKAIRAYQFLSLKPVVLVINVPEDGLKDTAAAEAVRAKYPYPCVQLSAGLEAEISQLAEAERGEFMKELGIDEPAVEKMNRLVFQGLGLISFFTVGEDEVRAWPVRRGASAVEAGGTIHSDIAKGFVRAEHMRYEELVALGSEAKVKEAGKFSLKGRDYIVADGDVLSFRFNV